LPLRGCGVTAGDGTLEEPGALDLGSLHDGSPWLSSHAPAQGKEQNSMRL
jgi:hypothetical protein